MSKERRIREGRTSDDADINQANTEEASEVPSTPEPTDTAPDETERSE